MKSEREKLDENSTSHYRTLNDVSATHLLKQSMIRIMTSKNLIILRLVMWSCHFAVTFSIMKVVIFAVAAILASAKASILLEPAQPKTYENFSVLRVEVHTREEFDLLYTVENLHFWNQGRVGGHADVMVSPELLQEVQKQLLRHNLKFSTMIENVGDLMRLEKVNAVFLD